MTLHEGDLRQVVAGALAKLVGPRLGEGATSYLLPPQTDIEAVQMYHNAFHELAPHLLEETARRGFTPTEIVAGIMQLGG